MRDRGLTILILGNGFDLAHGLPTKYSDFLEFCQRVELILNNEVVENKVVNDKEQRVSAFQKSWIDDWKTDKTIGERTITRFEYKKVKTNSNGKKHTATLDSPELPEFHSLLNDNVWYQYFRELYTDNLMKGENWIDFESEIRFIIQDVDEQSSSLTEHLEDVLKGVNDSFTDNEKLSNEKFGLFTNIILSSQYVQYARRRNPTRTLTVKDFREKAYKDLERLTRALEIYLTVFVEKIPITKIIPEIATLNPDYVINFNYTDTYQKVYGKGPVYHIHGKAHAEGSMEKNNMVLGIDEYWVGDERSKQINFAIFKKFAQRIQKHTGNESYKYLKEVQDIFVAHRNHWSGTADTSEVHPNGISYVYVFGHSLDITDKDILSDFIGSDATSVTVYCKDKGTAGELITNTIKLIGVEKLSDKANHIPCKLEYVIPQSS